MNKGYTVNKNKNVGYTVNKDEIERDFIIDINDYALGGLSE